MNALLRAAHDAAAIHGELQKSLLAAGLIGMVVCAAWAIQEWGIRKSAIALGWFGISCLGAVSILSLVFIAIGVL